MFIFFKAGDSKRETYFSWPAYVPIKMSRLQERGTAEFSTLLSEDTEVQERPSGCVPCGREELTSLRPTHPLPRSLPPLMIFLQVPAFDQVALPPTPPSGPSHEWSSGLRPCQLIGQLPSSDWMLLLRLANPTGYRNRASASTFSLLSLVLR